MKASLDIVLPCYNPAVSWEQHIITAYEELSQELPEETIQIILVNDGASTGISEGQIAVLNSSIPRFSYIKQPENIGKGAALRRGVEESESQYCIFTDVDFPYQTASFLKVFTILREQKADIAIGIKDPSYYSHLPWLRIQVSRFLRFLARTFLRISITDTQCGLKGFNRKGREVFLQTTINRYLADLEFIFLSDRQTDLRMMSVPVSLKSGVVFSKVNPKILFREGINFLRVFFRSVGN